MKTKNTTWRKGAVKLGVLTTLLGTWKADAESQMGKVSCTRTFTKILGGKYIHLVARWEFGPKVMRNLLYMELRIISFHSGHSLQMEKDQKA